ncbi:unnamed protein product [Caenorhabditis nigoni]
MTRSVARVPKKNNVTMTLLNTIVELERKKFQRSKVQAAQGLIVLRSQIKDEVEDGPKWAMTLRSRR